MPTFVIRFSHPPDQCPTSNSKVRELVQTKEPDIAALADLLGVKVVAGPLVLAAEHESLAILETDRVETVHGFLLESGLIQWNSARVSLAQPLREAIGELGRVPPPLY